MNTTPTPTTTTTTEEQSSNNTTAESLLEEDNEEDARSCQSEETASTSSAPISRSTERRQRFKALLRSLLEVDHTQVALVPGFRTSLLLMIEWAIFGIGNPTTTAFQLGCLFVGLTDPNGSLSLRLHSMGVTLICCVVVGTLLPGLVWQYPSLHFVLAFVVALATGLSPLLQSPSLFLSLKLATALFAINGSINRTTEGYGGLQISLFWTFMGGTLNLLAALLPELIGTHDAVRTDLFQVFHGMGWNLQRWTAHWATRQHLELAPIPHVTLSLCKTQDRIDKDEWMVPETREWMLQLMERADGIRTASLCLSNGYEMARNLGNGKRQNPHPHNHNHEEMDDLFLALGSASRRIGMALQFPWTIQYSPCTRRQLEQSADQVAKAAGVLQAKVESDLESGIVNQPMVWLPALLHLLQIEVSGVVEKLLDVPNWPCYSPISSVPKRVAGAFPTKFQGLKDDSAWAIRGYAIRFAIAFSLATIPELVLPRGTSGHWFPMTVALIMGPTQAATFTKAVHRMVGTLLGIGLGSALYPLFDYPPVLIVLLGLNTYAVCVFFPSSYVLFTLFITGWVFCTTVGVGADVGVTILYRCLWTIAAGVLVTVVTYTYPPKTEYTVTAKLASMAKTVKEYAQAVSEEHNLYGRIRLYQNEQQQPNDNCSGADKEVSVDQGALEQARQKVKETRTAVIEARVALLTCINEAVLTPGEPCLVDPHLVAPAVASDLVDAAVVPQFVSLVDNQCPGDLLSNVEAAFNEQTFANINRLVQRLETIDCRSGTANDASSDESSREATTKSPTVKHLSAFAIAIARAHKRLDDAGVPG